MASSTTRIAQTSFSGGIMSEDMYGRHDDTKFLAGLKTCENFICLPTGPVENRTGFAMVREVKNSAKRTRLIPFTFSSDQTLVLEFGENYIRFHTQGGTVMNGSVPYEVATPYLEADLFNIRFAQKDDVVTLVHPSYAPRELKRYGVTNWTLDTIQFNQALSAPTGVTAIKFTTGENEVNPNAYTFHYKVTALSSDRDQESVGSAKASCTANIYNNGTTIKITWTAVNGAGFYRVYRSVGGVYSYIGEISADDTLEMIDDNIEADSSVTPPRRDNLFASDNNYPACVSYYEQRRVFARTNNKPQQIVMSKTGTESDLSYSIPTKDDDRIKFEFASNERNAVEHLVPLARLLILTESAEWIATAMNSDAITPTSIGAKIQAYIGASSVRPVVVNNCVIYPAKRGGHVRVLAYSYSANGFASADMSLRSTGLFDHKTIKDLAFAKAPTQIVWAISSDGSLLGMTYIPDQEIYAWHKHTTDGEFESCCTVYEGNTDVLYCVIKRTINGSTKRFVERMMPREFATQADEFFVDCGATYSGTETQTITGLDYLEGKKVSILADGCVEPQQTVTNGSISLSFPATKVQVGLPITAKIETLPATLQIRDGTGGMGQQKNVNNVVLRLKDSSSVFVGAADGELTEYKQRSTEPMGSPPRLINGDIKVTIQPSWNKDGSIQVVQTNPLPLTVVSFSADVSVSG